MVLRQFRGNFYHYFGLKSSSHVFQTTEGRKNLGSIHFVLLRFLANILNDKYFSILLAPKLTQSQ